VVVIGICVKLATELVFRCPLKQSFILTTLTPLYAIIVTTVGFVMVGLLALDANEVSELYRGWKGVGTKGTEKDRRQEEGTEGQRDRGTEGGSDGRTQGWKEVG
jgi:hypothetical protein